MKRNKYWFKPKIYGYGAYPSSWEGFLVMIAYFVIILFLIFMIKDSKNPAFIPIVFAVTFSLVWISYKKTDGKWKWRWGTNRK